ncbi:MAG: hypothetical protein LBG73_10725 [Spirochaetaceae bacterium]|nr:hypothetical protein [Spirochaetaceae bacterium]
MLASCPYPNGSDLVYAPAQPEKNPPNNPDASVRTALYIDTSDTSDSAEILKTAGKYLVSVNNTETPYFDYVIISGAEIKRGKSIPMLELSETILEVLRNRRTLIKPLRDKGVKILLGITGGKDGVTFGVLTGVTEENDPSKDTEQALFARQIADICLYYELDGVEFYDKDGESEEQSPYPQIGASYWNGESLIEISDTNMALAETQCREAWTKGGKNMVNTMSYLIEMFGASASAQGDLPIDAKMNTPILVRETGYGKYLSPNIPRYAFATTMSCLTYSINSDSSINVYDIWESSIMDTDGNTFIGLRDYAPCIIDLGAINSYSLELFAKKLGRNGFMPAYGSDPEISGILGDTDYGLVYYTNLQPHSEDQLEKLSVVSREVFGADVLYRGN